MPSRSDPRLPALTDHHTSRGLGSGTAAPGSAHHRPGPEPVGRRRTRCSTTPHHCSAYSTPAHAPAWSPRDHPRRVALRLPRVLARRLQRAASTRHLAMLGSQRMARARPKSTAGTRTLISLLALIVRCVGGICGFGGGSLLAPTCSPPGSPPTKPRPRRSPPRSSPRSPASSPSATSSKMSSPRTNHDQPPSSAEHEFIALDSHHDKALPATSLRLRSTHGLTAAG